MQTVQPHVGAGHRGGGGSNVGAGHRGGGGSNVGTGHWGGCRCWAPGRGWV